MLKKPLRRVRRKKGAVLFAVISIMALLIAMASTAYFTAKSAYNSVISNYSYSQLYLSAISVSDMVVEAVVNDTMPSATADNYYDSLRDAVLAINTTGTANSIYAYSSNISNYSASEEDIIAGLVNSSPMLSGVLDGVVVNIYLDSIDDLGVSPTLAEDGVSTWYLRGYNYKFVTSAYYRNSTITVEDVVVANKLVLYTPDPGSNGGNGGTYTPGSTETITTSGGSGGGFSTFFTATGQKLEDGEIVRSSRVVKIKTHEISDDAFFQNTSTYFVNGNNNDFVGGITSTGSVYLEKFTTSISGANNDWWIGDDLVMTNNNANNLDLTNENSLYIADDLVIAANGKITAKDVYVEGDLYIMGQATFNCNLHVSGNIYYEMGDTDSDGNLSASAIAATDGVYLGSTRYDQFTNGWTVNGELDVNGIVETPSVPDWWDPSWGEYASTAKISVNGQDVTIPTGTAASTDDNNIGTYDPSAVEVTYSNRLPDEETDTFKDVESTSTVSAAVNSQAGENTEYYNYTSPSEALDTEVEINFENLAAVTDDKNNILYYECIYPIDPDDSDSPVVTIRSEDSNLNGNISVTIPYNENGYILDINADSISSMLGTNVNITYNIETSDDPEADAMAIILKNNILVDADGDGEEDDPGFSWQGNNYASNDNSSGTIIQTIGDGNVVLEMANLDADGNPVRYDPNKDGQYTVVTYVAGQKEVVGTEAQCAVIGAGGNLTSDAVNTMLQSGTSIPKDEYQNRIMLVSNMNDGIAVDAARQNNAFCGYIYAPNGELNNYAASGETAPIFGGMIVSTYNAELSKLYYAEPKPSTISSMLKSLDLWTPGGDSGDGTTTTITIPGSWDTWSTPPTPPGPGTWGNPVDTGEWEMKGSNFVG